MTTEVECQLRVIGQRKGKGVIERHKFLEQGACVARISHELVIRKEDTLGTQTLQILDFSQDVRDRLVTLSPAVEIDHVAELAVERAAASGLYACCAIRRDAPLQSTPFRRRAVRQIRFGDLYVLTPGRAVGPLPQKLRPRILGLVQKHAVDAGTDRVQLIGDSRTACTCVRAARAEEVRECGCAMTDLLEQCGNAHNVVVAAGQNGGFVDQAVEILVPQVDVE